MISPAHLKPAKGGGDGLYGEYFDNATLSGEPAFTRIDATVNFYWDDTQTPDPRITKSNNYSIRWTGTLTPLVSGKYALQPYSDDGVRLWLDGKTGDRRLETSRHHHQI